MQQTQWLVVFFCVCVCLFFSLFIVLAGLQKAEAFCLIHVVGTCPAKGALVISEVFTCIYRYV